ncbi:MAG: hypothetical protein ACKV0T_27980 [Planctomycetales bacterium]
MSAWTRLRLPIWGKPARREKLRGRQLIQPGIAFTLKGRESIPPAATRLNPDASPVCCAPMRG